MDIIAVTNRALCDIDFLERLEELAASGVQGIILREKDLSAAAYQQLAQQCQLRLQAASSLLIVNQQVAVARQLGISSLQLSFSAFQEQHQQLTDFDRVLVSVHSVEEAIQAAQWGAHGLIAGHIFATDCKKGLAPRGVAFLQQICHGVAIPVYAIGGINAETLPLLAHSDAVGACVMSQAMQGHFFWQCG